MSVADVGKSVPVTSGGVANLGHPAPRQQSATLTFLNQKFSTAPSAKSDAHSVEA